MGAPHQKWFISPPLPRFVGNQQIHPQSPVWDHGSVSSSCPSTLAGRRGRAQVHCSSRPCLRSRHCAAGCRQQARNGARGSDHFCPHKEEISTITHSLYDTSLLGLPFLTYSSLALAGACPAKLSELQMDVAFADREDFDSCNLEKEASKPTVFQHRVQGTS